MHLEILVEDASGACLIETLLPKILGGISKPHTWTVHPYKSVGHLRPDLRAHGDPAKRQLLDQLPRLLAGYAKTPYVDAVVVVADNDERDCKAFLQELRALAAQHAPTQKTLFRLAIEEIEAWYFGDRKALATAFPRARAEVIRKYRQDLACGTWEMFADAVYPGGSGRLKKQGWPLPGQTKHKWAQRIGPIMDVEQNVSPSFCKFRDGLRRLVASA